MASAAPGTALAFVNITGLGAGENLVGMDTRPLDNSLVALSTASRLYKVNAATGAATSLGALPGSFSVPSVGGPPRSHPPSARCPASTWPSSPRGTRPRAAAAASRSSSWTDERCQPRRPRLPA